MLLTSLFCLRIFCGGSMRQPNQKGILKKITTKQTSAARDRLRRRTTTGSMDRTRSKEKETESESPKRCFSRSEPECQIGEDESVSSGKRRYSFCLRFTDSVRQDRRNFPSIKSSGKLFQVLKFVD